MRKKIIALVVAVTMSLVWTSAAFADPNCTGSLGDRPASCFNVGPSDVGFHGQ